MLRLVTKSCLAATLLGSVLSTAALADAPRYVRIRNISTAGSGCPAGSVASSIRQDFDELKFEFDDFIAEAGPGVPLSESRKNCQILIDLDYPSGWSYTVQAVKVEGYVSLDSGVTAQEADSYYFQGQARTARLATTLSGPISRDYTLVDELGTSSMVWAPCGAQRALNINVTASVDASRSRWGSGLLTVSSVEPLKSRRSYGLVWQRCN